MKRSDRPIRRQLKKQLRANSIFAELDEPSLSQFVQDALWREFDTEEIVFWEGDIPIGLYYLQTGWLKVIKSAPTGREQVLRFLGPGEFFNEVSVFANQPNPATAVALESTGVWILQRNAVVALLEQHPAFAQHVIEQMSRRVLHLVTLVTDLSLRSVVGRLARLLLDTAADDMVQRPRWYTQSELAARLGTVPDVIQRALRDLDRQGAIEVARHQIRILDRQALAEMAN